MKSNNSLNILLSLASAGFLTSMSAVHADTLIVPTIDGASSYYPSFSTYVPAHLIDGDPEVGTSIGLGADYAANGNGGGTNGGDYDPVLKFSLPSSTILDGIGYAQRPDILSNGPGDVVTAIDLYFVSATTYAGFTPTAGSTPADLLVSLGTPSEVVMPSTTDIHFDINTFAAPATAEYVIAQFVGVTGGNPGGAELRFEEAAVPEPSTYALLGLGLASWLIAVRNRRSLS